MRALAGWALVAMLFASAASAAEAVAPKSAATPSGLEALARNIALGMQLADRPGTEAEFAQVQKLVDEGTKSAHGAVQKNPNSAEGQYLLGSWLLYGFRVVQVDRISYDVQGLEHRDKVSSVVQGHYDDPMEGLEALRKAYELAPQRADYLLDYGAALYDYERPQLAEAALKKVWMGDIRVTAAQKLRAALIMSDVESDRGDFASARGWLYRALADDPDYADVARRLRRLDVLQAEEAAMQSAPAAPAPAEEEMAPQYEEGADEEYVAPDQGEEEQPEGDWSEEAPAEPEAGE